MTKTDFLLTEKITSQEKDDEKNIESENVVFIENDLINKIHWKIRLKDCIYPFLGLLTTGFSAAIFAFTNVIVKWMTGVDPFTIAFFRFVFIFVLSLPTVIYTSFKKGVPLFPEGKRWALIFRAVFGSGNLIIHFYALKHMPLADTNLIAATAPIFTVISARLFLKEPIFKLDIFNIFLVLIGITLIVKPPFIFGDYEVYNTDPEFIIAVVTLILGAATLQANVYVLLRFLKDTPIETVMFNFGWIGSIVSGISALIFGSRTLPQETNQWLFLLVIGPVKRSYAVLY